MDYLGPYLLGPNDENQGIYTGDALELAIEIPDESVDFVLCDPVYWEIDHYRWLGELAWRCLRNGGNLIAQVGSEHRYDAETAIRESSLTPLPLLAQVYDMAFRRMFNPRVMQGWKPHLWFCKSSPDERLGDWLFDRHHSHGFPSKEGHEWADNPAFFEILIDKLSSTDNIVLDPFTGGGTVPSVCKILSRKWLAFEIDQEIANRARIRVAQTPMPLFALESQQLNLAL